jgi:hypothetical protein
MAGNNDLLIFSCGIDEFSETQIVNAVNQTNYLVDNLVVNIMAANRMFASQVNPFQSPVLSQNQSSTHFYALSGFAMETQMYS